MIDLIATIGFLKLKKGFLQKQKPLFYELTSLLFNQYFYSINISTNYFNSVNSNC